jgi:hypothetical protein
VKVKREYITGSNYLVTGSVLPIVGDLIAKANKGGKNKNR